ncbi:MAG: CDP-alcohol phosphatidyltransferase family protein [Acidobacteria bacterium]|jgi:CDP-diacylglycerol--glycerol-3-phosphate 3-phosphatidyltransferase|nr:MAG: CDP-alcohol phosphatidyltransferase family protein [Acidobacteriota bacterium]
MSYLIRELKPAFERNVEPLIRLFIRLGIRPSFITLSGLFLIALGSYLLYEGERLIAIVFLTLGALSDALDGSLARRSERDSSFGAFIDSLTDRISDALPLMAIALSSEDRYTSLISMLAMLFSFTVSYARARAEGLGYELKVGLFERPERWTLLLIGLTFGYELLTVSLIAIGSFITTLQRAYIFRKISRR